MVSKFLQPSGGSGTYIWTSSNTSVATVSTKGLVMTTNAVGHSQIRASDTRNLANFGSSEVCQTGTLMNDFSFFFIDFIDFVCQFKNSNPAKGQNAKLPKIIMKFCSSGLCS